MKIEVDLNDILSEEFGPPETLAESIKRQIVQELKNEIQSNIKNTLSDQISKLLDETAKVEVAKVMPGFIAGLLDYEYTPTDRYGSRSKATTFRAEVLKKITEEMEYKPEKDSYYREARENAFTKAVRSIIEAQTKLFQESFNQTVTKEFTATTVKLVTDELRKKFSI